MDESLIYKPAETPAAAASGTADKLKGIFKLSAGSSSSPACDTSKDSDGAAAATAGEPMYFRLLMGKPIAKKLPRTAPIISYGEQSLEAQYWFITTPVKASQLYSFIKENFVEDHRYATALDMLWQWLFRRDSRFLICSLSFHRYGRLNEEAIMRSGYELVRDGISLLEAGKYWQNNICFGFLGFNSFSTF